VADSVVVVHKDPSVGERLIAYVVAGGPESKAHKHLPSEVRAWLKERLPEHMVPSAIIPLDAFPLTPNGKTDRRALPGPGQTQISSEKIAPRSATERRLVEIWSSVLKLEQPISVNDNFFEIGGHSLLAVRLFSQIRKDFGENIPLATLFHAPTIAQFATVLDERNAKPAFSPLVAIQPKGTKPPFFAVHGVGGNVLSYFALAKYLGDDQPFYGLQARGLDGESAPHTRVQDMAAEYLLEIRRLQPTGPYYIGGFSFGCSVALEIAQILRREGEDVAMLGLIDGGLWRARDLLPFHVRLPRVALFQLSRVQLHVSELWNLRPKNIRSFVRSKRTTLTRRFRSIVWRSHHSRYENSGGELPAHLRRVDEAAYLAFRRYSPDFYDGPAVFFRSQDGWPLRFIDPNGGWGIVVRGGLEVRHVSGDHLTITQEPHVRILSRELQNALQAAQERASPKDLGRGNLG
jgi:thioesterase domain-containing protein/acyl carrier protein